MEHESDLAFGREQGVLQPETGIASAASPSSTAPSTPKSRIARRIGLVAGAIAALGILGVAYAAFIGLPGLVRIAPVSIVVHSSSSLPPEVQALEAQTAPSLFDRDTTNGYVPYADDSIDLALDQPREIHAIKVYGPAPYNLTVQALNGSTWSTISGLDNIKLANLAAGWNTLQATQLLTTSNLRLVLTLANGNAGGAGNGKGKGKGSTPTTGAIPEIEIWAAGEHSLVSGNNLVTAAVGATQSSGLSKTKMPAQARTYTATPDTAVVGGSLQTFGVSIDRPAARFKRAWLTYEAYGLANWVSPVRSINGQALQGGAFTFSGDYWAPLAEPINPNWLAPGKNTISFTLPTGLTGSYSVRNIRIVGELDDGNNFIARATTGSATSKASSETDAPQLIDGDLSSGWTPYNDPHGGNPTLTLYFDKPTQLDALNLDLVNSLSGTLNVDLLVGGQWQTAGLQTLNGKKLTAGWNTLSGFAPVAADALRITFQSGQGSAGEILEVTASGSGSGTAYVPAINVAYPDAGQFYGRQAYIRGYLTVPDNGSGPATLTVANSASTQNQAAADGSFGILVAKDDVGYANQTDTESWQVTLIAKYPDGQKLTQTVHLTQAGSAADAHGLLPNMPNPGLLAAIAAGDASIEIPPGALDKPLPIKITALAQQDLPALDPGMTNVTPYPSRGYRFTPHGTHFKKDVKVTLPFDPKLVPQGLTTADIKTYYFDTQRGHWVELTKYKLDGKKNKLTSLTNHFTDMINATLVVPDHPETASYNATQMKDIKAADPGAGFILIEPPKPNNMGDARLSYPIEIPKGRQGMQPQLAIQYSSGGGNGWLGLGWDLSTPSISIDTRWGAPRYSGTQETETYMLGGEMLTPVAHRGVLQPRTAEKIFHTRVEGGFQKIIRHGDKPTNYWWEVVDKSGTHSYYGGTNASDTNGKLGGGLGIFRWALRQTVDAHGNTVNYTYALAQDPGHAGGAPGYQLYIDHIDYTGTGGGNGSGGKAGPYTVTFKRSTGRPDVQIDARGRFKQVTNALLNEIDVSYNGNPVRSYKLNYQTGAFNKTLLASVVQYGKDGTTEFNRHTFAYYDDAQNADGSYKGFAPSTPWNIQDDSVSTVSMFGNGSVSALGGSVGSSVGGSFYFGAGACCDIVSKEVSGGARVGYSASQNDTVLVMADVNGDGLPDKVFKKGGGFFYRPNCSGVGSAATAGCAHGTGAYFGDKVQIGLPGLGHDNTTTTTAGGNVYFGTAVMAETSDSYTTSDTYVTDVNGDGIPDIVTGGQVIFGLVSNGVPAYSANSADTPVPIGAGVLDTSNLLADPTTIEQQRAATFPLLDSVRRWIAPYDGVVTITGNVQLAQDTSAARAQYQTADGVRVAIQQNATELWNTTIGATDYKPKTPNNVANLTVKAGDAIYFRVQSVNDGMYDQVTWDPEIIYQGVDTTRVDENNLAVYDYKASKDFTLAGRTTTTKAPLTGTLHLAGTLTKNAVTSDDITLVVYQNGNAVYSLPIARDKTGSFPISQDIQVAQLDQLQWKILTDSRIDASQIQLLPQAWYTAAQGVDGITDEQGNYVLQIHPTWTMDTYPAADTSAPQGVYVVKQSDIQPDGTLKVNVSAGPAPYFKGTIPLIFTVKRGGLLVAKNALMITGDGKKTQLSTGVTLNVPVTAGDVLYFSLATRDVSDAITYSVTAGQPIGSPAQPPAVPSALYRAAGEGLYPQPFRGWDAFGYNGNNPRDSKPIDQSLLVLDSNTTASNVTAYMYVSDPVLNHWTGPDAAAWISGAGAASSRIGLKTIAMPRGTRFAGASAPPRMSHSHNDSATVGVGASTGTSESQVDFEDLNGDRFPDVVSQGGVQYTATTGGLSGPAGGGVGSARTSNTTSFNDGIGGASTTITLSSPRGDTAAGGMRSSVPAKTGNAQPSVGFGGSIGGGTSDTQTDLIDMNGDGLPDKVFQDGTVWLNTGYEFVPDGNWGGGAINRGESVNTAINRGFSMDNGSIEGGMSLAIAESHSNESYADINGDGLPDKIGGSNTYSVRLNTGAGFAPEIAWPNGQARVAQDKNLTLGVDATYTAGIPIVIAGIKIVLTPNINGSTTLGRPELEFRDMDGDGYPDQAYSLKDSQLSVAINQIGRTNLLKQVNRPLGATITLDYARVGNTYAMPQSRWVMSTVSVNDGHAGDGVDVMQNAYAYQGGNYDRYERDFLGFRTVTSSQLNADGTVYRKVIDTYLNGSFYDKGLQIQEQTYDGQGNIYSETLNTYSLRDIVNGAELTPDQLAGQSVSYSMNTFFPMLTKAEHHFYEGGKGEKYTWTSQVYDSVGNITTFNDAGDLDEGGGLVTAAITYSQCTDSYIIGTPLSITVQDASGKTMRQRSGTIDCPTGEIRQISQFLADGSAATTDLAYNPDGNLQSVTGPANAKNQRFKLDYTYDTAIATFITQVKDSYGYQSSAAYDETSYEFGGPKSTTDLNGNVISYAYDQFGRTTGIQGPYEQGTQNLTLAFAYHPEAAVPYATTDHLNKDALGKILDPIKTVTFIDGLKRAIQVKKSGAVDQGNGASTPMMIVSGHATFDAMGRTVEQYYPVTEPLGQETTFNSSVDGVTPTTTEYDVMDRPVQTTLPDGTATAMEYGFGTDRNGVNQFLTTVTDANGKQKQSFRDMRQLITSVAEFNQGRTLWTSYAYDPLKEIVKVVDAKQNKTLVTYDNLGRRTSIDNPDTGLTTTIYDLASNPIHKITANLSAAHKSIDYTYDYSRLTHISYPDNKGNDVTYEYGGPGAPYNQAGRVVKVTDAAGTDEHRYGKLGETVWDQKTIASATQGKSANSPEVYTTQYAYDTFGRLMVLTLPDGEVLTHTYDAGGNLQSITGVEGAQGSNTSTGGMTTPYLQTLLYDKFEQRTYLKLGNGVETHYTYNAQNRRLTNLMSAGSVAGQFQNLNYAYDKVGNILGLQNQVAIPAASSMGGPTSQTFGYDDLYRLTSAKGAYQYAPGKTRNYTLGMQYDDIHNIVGKNQADAITEGGGKPVTQKATTYNWSYVYDPTGHPHAPVHIGNRTFQYDLNGNQTGWTNDNNGTRRTLLWDEENRISQIDDNGERNYYTYDAAGERTIKVTRQGQTVYVNQYYVVRNRSIVSKHIFAGSSRIATHMEMGNGNTGAYKGNGGGNGGSGGTGGGAGQGHANNGNGNGNNGNAWAYGQDQVHGQSGMDHGNSNGQGNGQAAQTSNGNGHGSQGKGNSGSNGNGGGNADTTVSSGEASVDTSNLPGNSETGLENALANGKGNKYGIYKHLEKEGDTVTGGEITSTAPAGATTAVNGQSSFLYYYHPDHLGSTGFVTDGNGKLYEHMEYFPFGESWVDEHSNTLRTPYLFTGKEYDQETGLYYFGARYYDPRTSVWQSPDPILDEYLDGERNGGVQVPAHLALYTYVKNNPLIMVDPDGKDGLMPITTDPKVAIEFSDDVISTTKAVLHALHNCLAPARLDAAVKWYGQQQDASGDWTYAIGGTVAEAMQDKGDTIMMALSMGRGGASASLGSLESKEASLSSRAARREVMRQQGIPTSQQPIAQSQNKSGREYRYNVPTPGGGTETKSVQQQTMDRSHPGEKHWEAGSVKRDPETGEMRMKYNRPQLTNDKSKVDYQ